jgi:hypothetical protein
MNTAQCVLNHALHGITLIKDSAEADRCGILCLLLKTALSSGAQVCHGTCAQKRVYFLIPTASTSYR